MSCVRHAGNLTGWVDLLDDPCSAKGRPGQAWTYLQCTRGVLKGFVFNGVVLGGKYMQVCVCDCACTNEKCTGCRPQSRLLSNSMHTEDVQPPDLKALLSAGTLEAVQWQNFPDVTEFTFRDCNLSGSLPEGVQSARQAHAHTHALDLDRRR